MNAAAEVGELLPARGLLPAEELLVLAGRPASQERRARFPLPLARLERIAALIHSGDLQREWLADGSGAAELQAPAVAFTQQFMGLIGGQLQIGLQARPIHRPAEVQLHSGQA